MFGDLYRKTHTGWKHSSKAGWLLREQSPDENRITKLEEQNRLLIGKLEELSGIIEKISCYTDQVSKE
jgi:TolA-binding protein